MTKDDKRKSVAQPSRRAFLTGAMKRLRGDQWTPTAAMKPRAPAPETQTQGPDTGPETVPETGLAALGTLREQVRADATDVAARKRLGLALFRLDYLVQARVEFEQMLRLGKKEDPDVLLHLGLILARTGKADKTAAIWKRYVATGAEPARPEIETLLARYASEVSPTASEMAETVERALGMAAPEPVISP